MVFRIVVYFSLLFIANAAIAGGFQVALQGVKQTGMGGTGVANPLDATAIYFNPGGLSFTQKNSLNLNAWIILPKAQFREQGTNNIYDMNAGASFPFAGYWSWNTNPKQRWKLGVGVYTPYGSTADWGNTWAGRYVLNKIQLRTIHVQPTFSYNIGNMVGIGAGFVYSRGSVEQSRVLPIMLNTGNEGQVNLSGKAGGYGFNVGALVHITPKLDIGASYKSSIKYNADNGSAKFTVPDAFIDSFPNSSISTTLQIPWSLDMGITYRPEPKLAINLDVNFVGWKVYDEVNIDFAQNTAVLNDITLPRNFKNAMTFRIGASYDIDSSFTIRFGTYLDLNPVPDGFVSPETPDADRFAITLGGTLHSGNRFDLDVSFTYLESVRRQELQSENFANLGGTYKGRAITIGVALAFDLAKKQKPVIIENPTAP